MKLVFRPEKFCCYHIVMFKIGGLLLFYNEQYPNVGRTYFWM